MRLLLILSPDLRMCLPPDPHRCERCKEATSSGHLRRVERIRGQERSTFECYCIRCTLQLGWARWEEDDSVPDRPEGDSRN